MGIGIRRLYEFGPYRIDPSKEVLSRANECIPLTSKAFQTLLVLVENSEQVVSKERLMRTLWPDTFVEESNLTKHVSMVRKALGQTAQDHGYIVTVPGVGYRFAQMVRVVPDIGAQDSALDDHVTPEAKVLVHAPGWKLGLGAAAIALLIGAGLTARFSHRSPPAVRLTEKDTVMLVDFVNSTGDPVFDDTLKQALSVSLNQSPFLNVLSENKEVATLKMMGRPEGKPLSPDLARELCQRVGGKAYIAGSIASLGSQYVVGVKAVNCVNGDTLAEDQASASSKERVLDGLDAAAAKLRTELGESLITVQKFDVPLEQATTSSLEALRAYSLGRREAREQGPRVALPYDLHAVQFDPNFAMGHVAVGYDYFILGEVGRASEYFTKAFQLSNQVSEREKLAIAAAYYQSVTGDLDEATRTYKEQIASYPRDSRAYLDLATVYGQQAQYEDAITAAREAVRLAPDDAASYGVLSYVLLAAQRMDEARQTIQQAQALRLDDFVLRQVSYALAFLNRDSAAMEEQAGWFTGKTAVENSGLSLESDTAAYAGRLRRARQLTEQSVDSAIRSGHKENAAIWRANAALREAGFGNDNDARKNAVDAGRLIAGGQAVQTETALALAMAGDTERPASLAADLSRRFPTDTQLRSIWLPTVRAQLALDHKDPAAALEALHSTVPVDRAAIQFLANVSCLYPVYVRGEAYLAARDSAAAAGEFQKILNHSGIVWNCWTGALAHLGVARANALQAKTLHGNDAEAARGRALSAYKDFLTLWNDADQDIPVLKEARAEYAELQY